MDGSVYLLYCSFVFPPKKPHKNKKLFVGNGIVQPAQKDFEKAISLDPNYTMAFVNLACVFDLLDNPEAAIGKIKELSKEQQNTNEAKRILAIAYYHADNENKAAEIWKEIE